ncbi:hypothetical protein NDN08_004728 [Rhodosorus marinus]|uniref:Aminopeptidase n=1 Tax=Rhodosorus marinus TaxID=101924 RepID=A0AAV8USN4_9RHOD|nr:hypothetical protein NDN08_004728 [Rhodosorus marinus]
MSEVESKRVLLPKNAKPSHYDLEFSPDLFPAEGSEPTFEGSATIYVKLVEATNTIVLNAKELKVTSGSICSSEDFCVRAEISLDEKNETVTLTAPEALSPGDYKIDTTFNGVLNEKMMGFYRSEYKDPLDSSKKKLMAVTQFEPTDARMAFPCFDEPNIKATFSVTMNAPESYTCLSNMPIIKEEAAEGKKKVVFDKTPIMSTYLLAFVVAELDFIKGETKDGVEFRVYTEKGRSELGQFALDCGVKVLPFFATFFEIAYPLPKMDMIAIPDFAAGAMENWGLVTYRETALLLDPSQSSAQAKARVAGVVAHELAHQWFGNLVTMDWWTHLWLNEGFATWAADLAVDTLFPEWKVWVQFVCTTLSSALHLDALRSSHAIEVEINDATEVNEIFDAISYLKGASVIRMLANYLSVDVFKQGLITYLKEFSYSNAATEDLWQHLETASGKPIKELMSNWTKQVGYPVLEVSDLGNGEVQVSQSRFLSNGTEDASKPTWMVPIGVLNAGSSESYYELLDGSSGQLSGVNTNSSEWTKLNAYQSGIFRIKYSDSMASKLITAIGKSELGPEDRLSLLSDSFALARAGRLPTVKALEITKAFSQETEYTCILSICAALTELSRLFAQEVDSEEYRGFKRLAEQLLVPLSKSVGWEAKPGESHIQSLLRSQVLGSLIEFEHEGTMSEAVARFKSFVSGEAELLPDLRLPCYFAAVEVLGKEGYDAVMQIYKETDLNEEMVRCMRALGAIPDVGVLEETLQWALAEVKAQDIYVVINSVAKNRRGKDLAWEFLQKEWENFVERFGKGSHFNTRMMGSCTEFSSEEKAVEVEKFFASATIVGATRTLEQCLESIRMRASWYQRDAEEVHAWISKV